MIKSITTTEDCAGTGQCVAVAPELFELGEDGLSRVIAQPDTPDLVEDAETAAMLCPMAAIELER